MRDKNKIRRTIEMVVNLPVTVEIIVSGPVLEEDEEPGDRNWEIVSTRTTTAGNSPKMVEEALDAEGRLGELDDLAEAAQDDQ
jgi:hypothetical protein